jgi:Cu(I)/Ag(I) efflux system membrane protein CusA/SilA
MIGWLVDLSGKHRIAVLLVYAALLIGAFQAAKRIPLDAIPELSDPQVILFTEWKGRSPTLVEDQVTYPLSSSLLATPHVTAVRGYSMFGMSFVYVLFEEGTDVYWARSRVVEAIASNRAKLPQDVTPVLGPDATGIGWVYEYALVDRSGKHDLAELRSLQDFTLRYALESVPGVAQVASVGGYERQYQVLLDPNKLRAFGVHVDDVANAIRRSNGEVGGRVLEMSGREYFIRGRGYLENLGDLENVSVRTGENGTPIRVGDVGEVRFGADLRRGLAELDGKGETVGAIVMARQGENALDVIEKVKTKLTALGSTLPEGVQIVPTYDRSTLIERAIATLRHALTEEAIVVSAVILLFLLHIRSALLPIVSLPVSVALAFIPMYVFGIPATIMSLGGIAIAIGATVDAEIVMIEACHKKLEHAPPNLTPSARAALLREAAKEVTPAIFFSLVIIALSFLPVFGLNGQAGRLFKPLAYTKTFVMLSAAIVSVTLAPALRDFLVRGRIRSERDHPVSKAILALYRPFVHIALRKPKTTLAMGVFALLSAIPPFLMLGSEFMPPLNEGDILYMPTTLPNVSIEEAKRQLERQDRILASFPEVKSVFGKIGRAESATDPAPLSMAETIVQLRPAEQWPSVHHARWFKGAPAVVRRMLHVAWPEEERESFEQLVRKMNAALELPGWTNAWTMPIKARVDMLTTGVRTPVGIKVFGANLPAIEAAGTSLEHLLRSVPGTRSVLYERSLGGVYVDIVPNRAALSRYGMQVQDLHDVIATAIGGEAVTTTTEGRQRFTVNVRYAEDFRSSPESLRDVRVPLRGNQVGSVPLSTLAEIRTVEGPPMLREEAGMLVGYVYIDLDPSRDVGRYVDDAKAAVATAQKQHLLALEKSMYIQWTGQYELLEGMRERMKILIPLALFAIALLLYLQFRNVTEVLIVFLSVPFALVGSVWLLYLLDYRISTAVLVGTIALVGLAAQTGVVMIVYIDQAFVKRLRAGKIRDRNDILHAHTEGTVLRVRPKLMTMATMLFGLVPLLWATGSGADVMKRIAAPMVGGLLSSAFLTLEIIPVIYTYWRFAQLERAQRTGRPLAEICGIS